MSHCFKKASVLNFIFLLLIILYGPSSLQAWWWPNGERICTAQGEQTCPCLVHDGSDGAIIAWADFRDGEYDIYAQRIDSNGNVIWQHNGVRVCNAFASQSFPRIATDGGGGAIIIWRDEREGVQRIYAQRITGNGDILWTDNGIILCNESVEQYHPEIIADGSGGAIIVFEQNNGSETDIYAQLVNATGVIQWGSCGIPISTASGLQHRPKIISDGLGGAIIAWRDFYNGIWAQRINSIGIAIWPINGVQVSVDGIEGPELTTDTVHGAIITWVGSDEHIYVQLVDKDGNIACNGGVPLPICLADGGQACPKITSDGGGGAIIVWEDFRYVRAIYAQKVSYDCNTLWNDNGVPVYSEQGTNRWSPEIASDGVGGAYVVWEDNRNDSYDIYYQWLASSNGAKMCPDQDSAYVCNSRGNQVLQQIILDGSNGAIITWRDDRKQGDCDIYAMRFDCFCEPYNADASELPIGFFLYQNIPNPFNPTTMIRFNLPQATHVKLYVYNVKGELVATILDKYMPEGRKDIIWNAKDDKGREVASGIYLYHLVAGDFVQTKKMVLIR